jgi:antitoxin FitA
MGVKDGWRGPDRDCTCPWRTIPVGAYFESRLSGRRGCTRQPWRSVSGDPDFTLSSVPQRWVPAHHGCDDIDMHFRTASIGGVADFDRPFEMAQLLVRNLPDDIVEALKRRAAKHYRSAEQEHREILQAALQSPRRPSLAEVLAAMPDVGKDEDFIREQAQRRG